MTVVWRGRQEPCEPQRANGGDVDLSPASDPAVVFSHWAATLPDTDPVPLIWEKDRTDEQVDEPDLQHY